MVTCVTVGRDQCWRVGAKEHPVYGGGRYEYLFLKILLPRQKGLLPRQKGLRTLKRDPETPPHPDL